MLLPEPHFRLEYHGAIYFTVAKITLTPEAVKQLIRPLSREGEAPAELFRIRSGCAARLEPRPPETFHSFPVIPCRRNFAELETKEPCPFVNQHRT